jgi:ADP-ribose pyrophosphatase
LTTPTTTPGIHQNPEPCWTVLTADGEGAGYEGAEYHSATKAEADTDAAGYAESGIVVQVVQRGEPCWTAVLLCGTPFIGHGDVEAAHFSSDTEIVESAQYQGGVLVTDGVFTCGDDSGCEVCEPVRRTIKQELSEADTDPDVFSVGVADGWADQITNPTAYDWKERRRHAKVPFRIVDDRPVNPRGQHLRYGRGELGHWGEHANADAFVFITVDGQRYLLMGERDDGHGWAIPGGGLEDGEDAIAGALRELAEETGVHIAAALLADRIQVGTFRHVADPREAREAWMVTAPVIIDVGPVDRLPALSCTSDLNRAVWIPAGTPEQARAAIAELGGTVFVAHEQMLTDAIVGWAK